MRKLFDAKSLAAGVVIGTLGITTVFAGGGIESASLSGAKVAVNGTALPLDRPLISVTMEGGRDAGLYAPVDELFGKLGYTVSYDSADNTVHVNSGTGPVLEGVPVVSAGDVAMNLANNAGQTNISESGAFQVENGQTLILDIASDIKGGTVDLFLFAPDGTERRITIGSGNTTEEVALEKGTWQYNCSGLFKDGGDVRIVGTVR